MRLSYHVYETEQDRPSDQTQGRIRDLVRIKTSSISTWDQIYNSGFVPKHWAVHATEFGYGLNNWNPKHVKPLIWECEAEYLPISELNPIKRPPRISFDGTLIEQPTFKDNKGYLTTNTAGELFTGIIKQVPIMDYSVRFNVASDEPWMQNYLGAVNSDSVRIRGLLWKPRQVLVGGITGSEPTNSNGIIYSEYSLRLMANPDGWSQEVLNRGTVELQPEYKFSRQDEAGTPINAQLTGNKIQVKLDVEEPVPLDLEGRRIPNWLASNILLSRLVTRTFHIQGELPFSKLPLQ